MSLDAMTWTRRLNEFDPSDISVPRFFGVRGVGMLARAVFAP